MNRWVRWVLSDAGRLSASHALAAGGATTLCGRAVPVPRVHAVYHCVAEVRLQTACLRCLARADAGKGAT